MGQAPAAAACSTAAKEFLVFDAAFTLTLIDGPTVLSNFTDAVSGTGPASSVSRSARARQSAEASAMPDCYSSGDNLRDTLRRRRVKENLRCEVAHTRAAA